MHIRPLIPEDYRAFCTLLGQVHALHHEARPDIYTPGNPADRGYFDALRCGEGGGCAFVAQEGDAVAGLCILLLRPPRSNPALTPRRVVNIEVLAVAPEYRRRGYAGALLAEARRCAADFGAEALELTVWPFNEAAIAFYRAQGFTLRSYTLEQRSQLAP